MSSALVTTYIYFFIIFKIILYIKVANTSYLATFNFRPANNNRLNSYGVGSGQYIFISAIYKNPGISQKDLTNLIKIDRATTAKALLKLEQNGYIDIIKDEDDKRYHKLYLTKKGIDFIPILDEI